MKWKLSELFRQWYVNLLAHDMWTFRRNMNWTFFLNFFSERGKLFSSGLSLFVKWTFIQAVNLKNYQMVRIQWKSSSDRDFTGGCNELQKINLFLTEIQSSTSLNFTYILVWTFKKVKQKLRMLLLRFHFPGRTTSRKCSPKAFSRRSKDRKSVG